MVVDKEVIWGPGEARIGFAILVDRELSISRPGEAKIKELGISKPREARIGFAILADKELSISRPGGVRIGLAY